MVGRELKNLYPEKPFPPSDETLLEVKDLNGYYEPTIKEASFELKKKEILGVVGLGLAVFVIPVLLVVGVISLLKLI